MMGKGRSLITLWVNLPDLFFKKKRENKGSLTNIKRWEESLVKKK